MAESLALKYRPGSWETIVGQRITATVLSQMVSKSEVPQGLLFSGSRGTGKTSTARLLSYALEADKIEIDAASAGSVSDVRTMLESLRYSMGSEYRVVIYDEAHSMSREAFNALLKTLEEPPSGTIFILVTTEPESIPKTVKSRLMEFVFNKVSVSDIFDRMVMVAQLEKISITSELLVFLASRADGSVRDALISLDMVSRAGVTDVDQYQELVGEYDTAPDLVDALMSGNSALLFSVSDELMKTTTDPNRVSSQLVSIMRDLLIIRAGGELELTGASLEKRKELALRLEPERILGALKILWDLKTKLRASSDARGNLDIALILVSEVFTRGKQIIAPVPVKKTEMAPKPVVQEEPRRLTFAELSKG